MARSAPVEKTASPRSARAGSRGLAENRSRSSYAGALLRPGRLPAATDQPIAPRLFGAQWESFLLSEAEQTIRSGSWQNRTWPVPAIPEPYARRPGQRRSVEPGIPHRSPNRESHKRAGKEEIPQRRRATAVLGAEFVGASRRVLKEHDLIGWHRQQDG